MRVGFQFTVGRATRKTGCVRGWRGAGCERKGRGTEDWENEKQERDSTLVFSRLDTRPKG